MIHSKRKQLIVLLLQLMCLVDSRSIIRPRRIQRPYLIARFNPDTIFERNDTSVIEFWPRYSPLADWIILADNRDPMSSCDYDFEIGRIPYNHRRLTDYTYNIAQQIPAFKFRPFYSKDLSYLFDSPPMDEPSLEISCRFDTIYFDPPYRYYGYIGSRQMVYDAHWDSIHVGYAPIPFIRQIDTVYTEPNTHHTKVFTSHDWYYIFDTYTESLVSHGYIEQLWRNFITLYSYRGVDSVLVAPNNQSICRFLHDEYQCDYQKWYYPIAYVFEKGQHIQTPIRASFQVPQLQNGVALLDSDDQIWEYQYNAQEDRYRFLNKTHLCHYLFFGKLPCCATQNTLLDPLESDDNVWMNTSIPEDGSGDVLLGE